MSILFCFQSYNEQARCQRPNFMCGPVLSENGSWRFCVKRGWLPALRKHETQDAPDGKDAKKSDNGEDT